MAELGLVRNGALLIKDRIVAMVGRGDRVCRSPDARKAVRLDARGKVVLPGFVDSHTHALFAAPRVEDYVARISGASYSQIARGGGGIRASARRMRSASERVLIERLKNVVRLFLEHGTTTAEVKSGYGLDLVQELKMLRAIRAVAEDAPCELVPTLLVHEIPARYTTERARFLQLVRRRLIPRVARERLAEFFDVFCDRGYFSLAEAKELLGAAASAGFKLKLHAEQLARTGAARMAAGLNAVSVDHLDHVSQTDIRWLRGTRTIATLLPGSVLHLGSTDYPPARRLIDGGIPVALATNFNPGSSPTLNMQMILSLACSQMRMTPAEAITAATIHGAYAVGRGARVGSLELGKQADLAIMDVDDYREIPYFFGMNHCATVIKKGRV
ncbi:MAG: imidazolonepropionase, partial [Nitrospiraceae bacterium]